MRKKTFTLIELVMIIVIVMILAGVSFRPLAQFYRSWQFINNRMVILWGSRSAMQDMITNIRMVKDEDSIYAATSNRFDFDIEDENGNITNVDYEFSGNNLLKNGSVFMGDVSYGTFTYYPSSADIQSVGIDLDLTSGNQTISSQVIVKCRNLD